MGSWLASISKQFDDKPGGGFGDAVGGAGAAVADFNADAYNSIAGVNADNMGIFEENAFGSKLVSAGTFGLGGEGGLITDVLMPGQGAPGEGSSQPSQPQQQPQQQSTGGISQILLLGALVVGAIVLIGGDD